MQAIKYPKISGDNHGRLSEDGYMTTTGGDLDVRWGADEFIVQTNVQGKYGTFSIASDGVWSYTTDNTLEATQALTQGQHERDTFIVMHASGLNGIEVIVSISGVDNENWPEPGLVGLADPIVYDLF